jgi:hypothetical protein
MFSGGTIVFPQGTFNYENDANAVNIAEVVFSYYWTADTLRRKYYPDEVTTTTELWSGANWHAPGVADEVNLDLYDSHLLPDPPNDPNDPNYANYPIYTYFIKELAGLSIPYNDYPEEYRFESPILGIGNFTNLISLYAPYNKLTSQDVAGLSKLRTLNLRANELTALNVSTLTKLKELDLTDNHLTTLDVSGLSKLTSLNVSKNDLTTLNVSGLSKLNELYLYDLELTSLDVTGCDPYLRIYVNEEDNIGNITGLLGTMSIIPQQ